MCKEERDHNEVVESAGGTTSPDNGNSGPFAYIVTGIAVGITLVLAIIGSGCASLIIGAVGNSHSSPSPSRDAYDWMFDEDLNNMDFEQWLNNNYNMGHPGQTDNSGTSANRVSVSEALDYDLAPYNASVGNLVSASSYAGTPDNVRSFVREVIERDDDYARRVAQCLNIAALDEGQRASKLDEARSLCDEARNAFLGMELPSLDSPNNGEVRDLLGTAADDISQRWASTADEVALLQQDKISTRQLWDADDKVLQLTEDAADALQNAMSTAASN